MTECPSSSRRSAQYRPMRWLAPVIKIGGLVWGMFHDWADGEDALATAARLPGSLHQPALSFFNRSFLLAVPAVAPDGDAGAARTNRNECARRHCSDIRPHRQSSRLLRYGPGEHRS